MNNQNGFSPKTWGPLLWSFLHILSLSYPQHPTAAQKRYYMEFIVSLQKVLPCKTCRENFARHLDHIDFSQKHMANRESFSKAIYDLHCAVNCTNNVASQPKYEDVVAFYEDVRHTGSRFVIGVAPSKSRSSGFRIVK